MNTKIITCFIILTVSNISFANDFNHDQLAKNISLLIAEQRRTYDLYVPLAAGSSKFPLVILLHGHGGDADVMTGENGKKAPYKLWLGIAERENLIVAVPDGIKGPDGYRGWNDCRKDAESNPNTDDVGFIKALIKDIEKRYPLDEKRIYVTGTSNGGAMTLRLAMEMSNTIAAAAAVVAAMPVYNECRKPTRPISILFMNGTKDPLVPYKGGKVGKRGYKRGEVKSTMDSIIWWVKHNGAVLKPDIHEYPNKSRWDRSTVRRLTYAGGNGGTEVVLYEIVGGGHTEPSIEQKYSRLYRRIVGKQNRDIEMAEIVWSFFKNKVRR